ncbi:MAG: cell division protein [Thermovirgaceae bacterium]|nr:cell division protein [Thermovirgaceae bacterium]
MKENDGKGYVLGRQLFIELWSLLGLESMVCEGAADFGGCLQRLKGEDVAFVLVESDWFRNIPDIYKKRIKSENSPVWVEIPSLNSSVKNWE